MMTYNPKNKPSDSNSARSRDSIRLVAAIITLGFFCIHFGPLIWNKDPSDPSLPSVSTVRSDLKLLYIVTTIAEFDTGKRQTQKGADRFSETLIPVVRQGVESMRSFGYSVDVVLISHYALSPQRHFQLRQALPPTVGLQYWDDATPLGYKLEDKRHLRLNNVTRALARQHRFVLKDKLPYYDVFVNFEDDMLIKGDAVQNYVELTQELFRLRDTAPDRPLLQRLGGSEFYGVLSKQQLQRIFPGFIRVESLLNEAKYPAQNELLPVPFTNRPLIDPQPCCHLDYVNSNPNRPTSPTSDSLILWETSIFALGVRKMPLKSNMKWAVLLRGPRVMDWNLHVGDYWSGRDGYFGDMRDENNQTRPDPKMFQYINNQGGWMATQQQLWEWHSQICPGGYLPPFESPDYNFDGLDMRNVEYWSGGLNLYSREHGCNMYRIVSLEADRFSKQLLYHSANNKQRQLKGRREMMTKVNDFYAQLMTVQHNAQAEMAKRVVALAQSMKQA